MQFKNAISVKNILLLYKFKYSNGKSNSGMNENQNFFEENKMKKKLLKNLKKLTL